MLAVQSGRDNACGPASGRRRSGACILRSATTQGGHAMASITIRASDGSGSFAAYLVEPAKKPAGAIVLIQEIFGVNQAMRDIAAWAADIGFIAVCPDLFWRIEPGIDITDKTDAEWKRAFELFNAFDVDAGVGDIAATIAVVRGDSTCNGKVGAV